MRWRIDPHAAEPPSRQLVSAVLDEVAAGSLRAGERLPSVRALAGEAQVNPNTVAKAYRELELRGVVEGRNGSGVFVTGEGPERARELREDSTLAALRRALEEALRAGHAPRRLRAELDRQLGGVAAARREER